MKKTKLQEGFTLIEMIVAVGLVMLLTAIVLAPLSIFRDSQILNGDATQVYSFLNEARSYTLSSKALSEYGMRINGNRVIVFKGLSFSSSSPDNIEYVLSPSTEIKNVSLAEGGLDIIFDRLTGETSDFGSFELGLRKEQEKIKTISVTQTGLISQ
jgi:type II secretory pathway pseudopilin PulG